MEPKVRMVSPEVLMEQLPELLEEARAVPLVISGNSMRPFLVHGRDTVFLSKITDSPGKGDMVLYRRDNGNFVLHRICHEQEGIYTLAGDAYPVTEPGIRRDQMLAVVTAVRRKGKLLQPGSFWWEFFARVWVRMIPLRLTCLRIYSATAGKIVRKGRRSHDRSA